MLWLLAWFGAVVCIALVGAFLKARQEIRKLRNDNRNLLLNGSYFE